MSLNSRILLLILSILASSNNITSAQIEQDNSQQVAKQEKPTLRKKIIKWGGIITGIGATIAGAAWLYFHKNQSGNRQISRQEEANRAYQEEWQGRRLESGFVLELEDAPNLIELERLYQNGQFKGGQSEKAYNKKKAELTKKLEQSPILNTKQEFIDSINAANTLDSLFDLQFMTQDNIGTSKGFQTIDEYKQLVEDPEVVEVYYSKEPLMYLQTLKDVSDSEKRAERIKLYIDRIIRNSRTPALLEIKYKALQNINNQEFNDALRSEKVQMNLKEEQELLRTTQDNLFGYQRNIKYKGRDRDLFL